MRENGLHQVGDSVQKVLAIVEHQQPDPALQRLGHRLGHGLPRLLGDAQHRGHRVGHRSGIGYRSQLEKPHPVREFVGQPPGDFGREAGLADPAHPGQRDKPMSLYRRLNLAGVGLAPDEARGRRPQIPLTRIHCPQRRKLRAQAGRAHLKHPHRRGQVSQPPCPQVHQIEPAEQTRSRLGHQDLTAVACGHHPCGAVEHSAEVVAVAQFGLTGRQPHPHW